VTETAVRTVDRLPAEWEVARFSELLRAHLPRLRARHHIDGPALYGSYVHNEQRPDSDLDILIEFDRTPGLLGFIGLQDEISELLGVTVDLVMPAALRSPLREIILDEAVAL
jgi:uncharacterized protein